MRGRSARSMARAFGAAVLLTAVLGPALAPVHSAAEAALSPSTCNEITKLAEDFAGRASVAVVDLESGDRCDVDASTPMRSASLYKLFVMLEVFDEADRGVLSFDDPLTIEPRHTIDDPPEYRAAFAHTVTIGEAVDAMITRSDNGSAVALMERVSYDRVATIAARFGFPGTTLADDTFETTAEDVAGFFERLYAGELVNPLASGRMLELLRRQQIQTMLPVGLPAGTTIAHKTGNLDYQAHDGGIVTAPGGSYIVVAMTEAEPVAGIEASYAFIPALAALTFEAYAAPRPIAEPGEPATAPTAATTSAVAPETTAAADASALVAAASAEAGAAQPIPTVTPSWWPIEIDAASGAGAAGVAAMAMAVATLAIWTRRRGAHEPAEVSISRQESGDSRMTITRRPDYAADESPDPSRKDPDMRLRRQQSDDATNDGGLADSEQAGSGQALSLTPAAAANTSATAAAAPTAGTPAAPGVIDSPRLRRLAQYFSVQKELLDGVRAEVEQETAPLIDLLLRQANTMQRVMSNLDERLRPLELYAETEEANLAKLRERLSEDGTEFLNRSFADYIAQQRERISETRTRIGEQRIPFERFADDEASAVETALARFDQDVALLEEIQAEQRRVTTRLLEAMRSDTFLAVKDYLAERHEALVDLAGRNVTDPTAIAGALRAKAAAVPQAPANAPGAQHLAEVLRTTSEADARFVKPAEAAAAAAKAATAASAAEAKKARALQAGSSNGAGESVNATDSDAPADANLIEAVGELTDQESLNVTPAG